MNEKSGQGTVTAGKGYTVRAGTGYTIFISNADIDDIIKIVESLERAVLLIDAVSETVKYEIKNNKVEFLEL